jgi:iron(III) transport system substrate-binding protein
MTIKRVLGAAFGGALFFHAAIASAAPEAPKLDGAAFKKLYDAAIAANETEVIYYSPARTEETEALIGIWDANFPKVSLKIVAKKAPELITQIEAERAAGQKRVDVATHTQPYVSTIWKEKGFYEPYKLSSFDKLAPDYADKDGAFYATGAYLLPAAYNTKLIPDASQLPRSFAEFLDPKWKGKIIVADPATGGNPRTFFLGLLQSGQLTWDYLEKLAKQDVLFVPGNAELVRALASGERPVALTVSSFNVLTAKEKGQSIELYPLNDGTIITEQSTGILNGAPHPNAAKLLLEVLASGKGQAVIAEAGKGWPTNADAPEIPSLPKLASFKTIHLDLSKISDEASTNEFLKKFAKTFGRE